MTGTYTIGVSSLTRTTKPSQAFGLWLISPARSFLFFIVWGVHADKQNICWQLRLRVPPESCFALFCFWRHVKTTPPTYLWLGFRPFWYYYSSHLDVSGDYYADADAWLELRPFGPLGGYIFLLEGSKAVPTPMRGYLHCH